MSERNNWSLFADLSVHNYFRGLSLLANKARRTKLEEEKQRNKEGLKKAKVSEVGETPKKVKKTKLEIQNYSNLNIKSSRSRHPRYIIITCLTPSLQTQPHPQAIILLSVIELHSCQSFYKLKPYF